MREIEFRGKAMDGKWKYGLLTKKKIRNSGKFSYAIATGDCSSTNTIPISEESIGQFTGFKDIGGKKIFEGDIIQNTKHTELIYKVNISNGCWRSTMDHDCNSLNLSWLLEHSSQKVIGNIHDNKELLKGA